MATLSTEIRNIVELGMWQHFKQIRNIVEYRYMATLSTEIRNIVVSQFSKSKLHRIGNRNSQYCRIGNTYDCSCLTVKQEQTTLNL